MNKEEQLDVLTNAAKEALLELRPGELLAMLRNLHPDPREQSHTTRVLGRAGEEKQLVDLICERIQSTGAEEDVAMVERVTGRKRGWWVSLAQGEMACACRLLLYRRLKARNWTWAEIGWLMARSRSCAWNACNKDDKAGNPPNIALHEKRGAR